MSEVLLQQNNAHTLYPLFDTLDEAIIELSFQSTVKTLNLRAAQLLQWDRANVNGKNFFELCFQSHTPTIINHDDILKLQHKQNIPNVTIEYNNDCFIEWSFISNLHSMNLHVASLWLIGKNITLQKTLDDYTLLLNNIIQNTPLTIYWKNAHGQYLGCNKAVLKMGKLKDYNEIIGKTDFELPWRSHAAEIQVRDKKIMLSGEPYVCEEPSFNEDGQEICVLSQKIPLRDHKNEVVGIIGISFDITDRKRYERELMQAKNKAEAASVAKSKFISNMSHDLRTPLVGIMPMSHSLMLKETDPKKQKFLECIFNSSQALLNLLNNIINVANLETGEMSIEISEFPISELISEIIAFVTPTAQMQKLDLQSYIDPKVPSHWYSDRHKLFRVLANLVGNAIKFTEQGSVRVEVMLAHSDIKTHIIDTGIGIPSDKFQVIFERLQRLTASHESKYEGSGIGLYEAKLFIEELGGQISVQSEVGTGSTFTVTFPVEKVVKGVDSRVGGNDK